MTSERLGAVIVAAGAAAILLLTVVSSVALTLLAVRKPADKTAGPNALQRWFSAHEGARNAMMVVMTVMAFGPAFLFRGLKAAAQAATGWSRRKLVGADAPTGLPMDVVAAATTSAAAEAAARAALVRRPAVAEHEERTPPAHAPHEAVGVLTGLPVGASTTEEADKPAVSL